jgi:hypothetical protein
MNSEAVGDRPSRRGARDAARGIARSALAERYGAALAAKAAAQTWSAQHDIAWRLPPSRPWWLPRRNHVMLASQFLHGERVAQGACERLLPLLPEGSLRLALASQIADEARHCEAHQRYLARLGDIAPPRPALAHAFRHIADWHGPAAGLVLATHVVLESEALAIQQDLVRDFPCPILQRICQLAARDEGRHLTLGRILLHAADLPAHPLDERLALHRRLRHFWSDCAQAVVVDHGLVLAHAVPLSRLEAGWHRLQRVFRRVGLIGMGEERAFGAVGAPGGGA